MIYRILFTLAAIWIWVYTASYGMWEYRNNSRKNAIPIFAVSIAGIVLALLAAILC